MTKPIVRIFRPRRLSRIQAYHFYERLNVLHLSTVHIFLHISYESEIKLIPLICQQINICINRGSNYLCFGAMKNYKLFKRSRTTLKYKSIIVKILPTKLLKSGRPNLNRCFLAYMYKFSLFIYLFRVSVSSVQK